MFVDDGLLKFVVQEMGSDYVLARAANGGMLGSRKGVDIPDAAMDLPALSQKDLGACQRTSGRPHWWQQLC
jgi:pyruvate kinase